MSSARGGNPPPGSSPHNTPLPPECSVPMAPGSLVGTVTPGAPRGLPSLAWLSGRRLVWERHGTQESYLPALNLTPLGESVDPTQALQTQTRGRAVAAAAHADPGREEGGRQCRAPGS